MEWLAKFFDEVAKLLIGSMPGHPFPYEDVVVPFVANEIAATHMQVAVTLTGFALVGITSVIVLPGQDRNVETLQTIKMLSITLVIGMMTSFLYSSTAGDVGAKAYFQFHYASVLFAMLSFLVFGGITLTLRHFRGDTGWFMRLLTTVTVIFASTRIIDDMFHLIDYAFEGSMDMKGWVWLWVLVWLGVAVLSLCIVSLMRNLTVPRWVKHFLFDGFCIAVLFLAVVYGLWHGATTNIPEHHLIILDHAPFMILVPLLMIGAWMIALVWSDLGEPNVNSVRIRRNAPSLKRRSSLKLLPRQRSRRR